MKQILASLSAFIDNRKSSPEIQSFNITDIRESGSDVAGTMRLLAVQPIDESNPSSESALEVEFDVLFNFDFDDDGELYIDSLSADESTTEFEFVGRCAKFEADTSTDWAYELNSRLCPFDVIVGQMNGYSNQAFEQALALCQQMRARHKHD